MHHIIIHVIDSLRGLEFLRLPFFGLVGVTNAIPIRISAVPVRKHQPLFRHLNFHLLCPSFEGPFFYVHCDTMHEVNFVRLNFVKLILRRIHGGGRSSVQCFLEGIRNI